MGTVPLSVVIIARNEAGRLRDCIESARWAGEVLVVDDRSTDDTARLAESLGARVLARAMDIEGRHRNWAHAQARHDWILSLDADERVTPELAEEIRGLFAAGPRFELYAIPRRNFIGGRWIRYGGWYPSAQIKLFKRTALRWEETTVHPRAISDKPGGTLTHDLIHLSYRDLADFLDKLNRQTTLEAEKWRLDGRRVTLGKALWRTADRALRSYVGKQGWRDGFWGLVTAVLAGLYQFVAWAKYTEQRRALAVEAVVAPFGSLVVDQERYDRQLLMSHLCAYRIAAHVGRRKRMLEIGCGAGYGAFYLAHHAREVTAIDVQQPKLEQAARLFRRDNVRFLPAQGSRLAFPDASFECVGTFQVIEHIPEPELETFVREMARVLTPDGVLVVSTLNLDHNCKDPATYVKPSFHEKEFRPEELRALLQRAFPAVELFGLYPGRRYRIYRRLKKWGLDKWGPARWNPVRRFLQTLDTDAHELRPQLDASAVDLIAICRKQAAPLDGLPLLRR
ncbi:MAG: methyltransferase domain-containing protein [Candidatus Omnitrophica bacterium]|nr:methyltransferase domain-containing protein [Candidatus Omnitrophota bacterium]